MGNPITGMLDSFDQPKQAQAAPRAPAPAAVNPISNMLNSFDTAQPTPAPEAKKAAPDIYSTNPVSDAMKSFDVRGSVSLSSAEAEQSKRPDPENQVDEPWYSKTWDWLNKPLYDAHQWGTRDGAGNVERGIESGVEDLISGLTSPLSIALTVGTFGGDFVANAGIQGLRAIGVTERAASFVAKGMKTLLDAGFSGQMLKGLITQVPEALDALKDGDYETASRLATTIAAGSALVAKGAQHAFEDATYVNDFMKGRTMNQAETMRTTKQIAGKLDEGRAVAGQESKAFAEKVKGMLKEAGAEDEISQGAIRKYMVAGGDMDLLRNQHDALAGSLQTIKEAPEDAAARQQGVELKQWLGKSKLVDKNGPKTMFLTDSEPGTNKLGPTLTGAGDPADGHFVRVEKTKDFGSLENLKKFVADSGGEEQAKEALNKAGFDSILYKGAEGKPSLVLTGDDQMRPAQQMKEAAGKIWNKDFVYHATDAKNADMVRNAGIKNPTQKSVTFGETPEEALKGAATPVSGNRGDLKVFAVPRSEVMGAEPEKVDLQKVETTHMPSHEVVLDENGQPTGHVVPLRGKVPLTLDNTRFNSEYNEGEKQQLLEMYKKAQTLTDEQKAVADILRKHYDNHFNKAFNEGMIRHAIENYHPQAWAKDRPGVLESLFGVKHEPSDNAAFNNLRHQTDNGAFDTNISAAKQRAFETEFQGEMAGWKSKSNDLAYHAADYKYKLDRAIAARDFLENLRASGAKAADGRPLVVLSGSGHVVGEESGNPALLVNPNKVRNVQISHEIIKALQEEVDPKVGLSKLQTMLNNGALEKLPWTKEVLNEESGEMEKVPTFAWSSDGYQRVDHPSMRDWHYLGQDTAGNNAIIKGDMKIHPEAAEYVKQVVGADISKFRQSPYLRTLMAAQREAKGALLSFSPFHAVQEGLRGVMLGINPFDWKPVDIAGDPLLRLGVRNNLTFPDYKAEDMFSEGNSSHSKLIGKIPGLGRIQDYIHDFTFNKLIPSLKARGFKSVYQRFLEKMPDSSSDEVAHAAATYVNDTFGGQHWRDLGASATSQDMMRAIALAPDWLTSEIRSLWRVAGGMGKPAAEIARADMTKLVAGMYVTARVLNMLSSGKLHPEAPFGIAVAGQHGEDEKIYSLRTLPTDLVHVITSPREFAMGRVNPLVVKTAIEGLTARDQFGRKVTGEQQFSDFYHNFIPIGGQALLKGNTGGLTNADQAIKAGGATVYKYRTEAEKLAQEYASNHMPSGPVDDDQLKTHQRNIQLEDGLRNGTVAKGDVRRMMPEREANTVITQAGMSPLQARFNRLPLKEALNVWELSTPKERDELHAMLWKKRVNYIQSHTGSQRSSDPTWTKMQKVMADLHGR